MSRSAEFMSRTTELRYTKCHRCPFYQAEECLIAPSRILLYFYCPASEGFRHSEVLPTGLGRPSLTLNPGVAKE